MIHSSLNIKVNVADSTDVINCKYQCIVSSLIYYYIGTNKRCKLRHVFYFSRRDVNCCVLFFKEKGEACILVLEWEA
jgi:hypothetical protein